MEQLVPRSLQFTSEVEAERQLNLPIRADADLVRDRRSQHTEVRAGRGCGERLAGLHARTGAVRDALSQPEIAGIGKVRAIEDVVELRPELQIPGLRKAE